MPMMTIDVDIPAGGVVDPLEAWDYRYAPFRGTLRAWLQENCSHAALGTPNLLATVKSGSDTLMQESVLGQIDNTDITSSYLPTNERCIPVVDEVAAGDKISISVRNVDAANPRTLVGVVELIPYGS